ncbi:MAG: response regulator [Candidatus Acidiferrales bacterium]
MTVATKAAQSGRAISHPKLYRILIADDHALVRRGVRDLLADQPGIEICGEVTTGPETIDSIRKLKPNLVILDLTMPEMTGLEAARVIREESPETDVMILSMHFSPDLAREVFLAGAMAYVLKSDADRELLAAVDHVRHHQPFFTAQLTASMMQIFLDGQNPDAASGTATLSPRQIEILQLLAEGSSNKQIAAALSISIRTVESHRHHIMRRMQFETFSHLVRFAVRNNLVEV